MLGPRPRAPRPLARRERSRLSSRLGTAPKEASTAILLASVWAESQLSSTDDIVPRLDSELLARLEAAWTAQSAPIVDHLAPGLTDDEMSEIVSPLRLRLPLEARAWWGWHDGVPWRGDGEATPERGLGPGLEYMPLRDAVKDYLLDRKIFSDVEGAPEPFRPAAYFRSLEARV